MAPGRALHLGAGEGRNGDDPNTAETRHGSRIGGAGGAGDGLTT